MLHKSNCRFQVGVAYLSLMHCFLVTSENITIDHILSRSRSFGLNYCCRQYEFNCNQFDVIGSKATVFGEIT